MECFRAEKDHFACLSILYFCSLYAFSYISCLGTIGQILGKAVLLNTTSSTVSISSREQEPFALLNLYKDSEVFVSSFKDYWYQPFKKYTNMVSSVFHERTSSTWDVLTKGTKLVPLWKHYRKIYFPFCYCT